MSLTVESWIEALESGKYEQTSERLREGDCFCCLGVACDLSGMGVWFDEDDDATYQTGDTSSKVFLPSAIQNLLRLTSNFGTFSFYHLPGDLQDEILNAGGRVSGNLTDLNDAGVPFPLIAKVIRARPKGLFREETSS